MGGGGHVEFKISNSTKLKLSGVKGCNHLFLKEDDMAVLVSVYIYMYSKDEYRE